MTPYHTPRYGAIPLAVLFAAGSGFVLFEDVLRHGAELSTGHVMTGLALVGGIAAGHYCWPEVQARRWLSGLGCLLMFLACTAYIVTASGARNAEGQAAKAARIATDNGERARLEAQRRTHEERLDDARRQVAAECGTGKGRRCAGRRETLAVYELAVAGVEARIATLSPAREANAGYAHAGRVWAAMTGSDAQSAAQRLELLMPFALVLISEIGTIVFANMALSGAPRRRFGRPSAADSAQTSFPLASFPPGVPAWQPAPLPTPSPTPPRGGRRRKTKAEPATVVPFPQRHPVVTALERAGGTVASNQELAQLMDVTEGEASKRVAEVRHLLDIRRIGKRREISLRAVRLGGRAA